MVRLCHFPDLTYRVFSQSFFFIRWAVNWRLREDGMLFGGIVFIPPGEHRRGMLPWKCVGLSLHLSLIRIFLETVAKGVWKAPLTSKSPNTSGVSKKCPLLIKSVIMRHCQPTTAVRCPQFGHFQGVSNSDRADWQADRGRGEKKDTESKTDR